MDYFLKNTRMKTQKKTKIHFETILVFGICFILFALTNQIQAQNKENVFFEKSENFFPGWQEAERQNIDWGYLTVPENWDTPSGKTIKLAVARLSSFSANPSKSPVVFLQGGPGGGAIHSIWQWFDHPLRNQSDIILIDVRGTGLSEPKLCPDLGKEYLRILAENLSEKEAITYRIKAAMNCKSELIERGIDVSAYTSTFIAHDLHALKKKLGYKTWNIYGVSYGTRIALEYVRSYPDDLENLILDSAIPPNARYYEQNTSNYIQSLENVFNTCSTDPKCQERYGDLTSLLIKTKQKLEQTPLTVPMDKEILSSEKFIFNHQDMMFALHQSLYNKKIIEVLPLMISEFNKGNKDLIAALVASLSGGLSLDFGTYYCMLCNETIPFNSFENYLKENEKNSILPNGLTFYRAEFSICEQWNIQSTDSTLTAPVPIQKPTLILAGELDPITPPFYGELTSTSSTHSFYSEIPSYGHGPGFSDCGKDQIASFIQAPNEKPSESCFNKDAHLEFVDNITINKGVFNMARILQKPKIVSLLPFLIALGILIIFIVGWIVQYTIKKIKALNTLKREVIITRYLIGLCTFILIISLGGIVYAIQQTALKNFYILALGLPKSFSIFLLLPYLILILLIIFFVVQIKWKNQFSMKQKISYYTSFLALSICIGYLIHLGILF